MIIDLRVEIPASEMDADRAAILVRGLTEQFKGIGGEPKASSRRKADGTYPTAAFDKALEQKFANFPTSKGARHTIFSEQTGIPMQKLGEWMNSGFVPEFAMVAINAIKPGKIRQMAWTHEENLRFWEALRQTPPPSDPSLAAMLSKEWGRRITVYAIRQARNRFHRLVQS